MFFILYIATEHPGVLCTFSLVTYLIPDLTYSCLGLGRSEFDVCFLSH